MARKPKLNVEALTALGVERLAQVVLDEAQGNAAFRKILNAALAGQKGPKAVMALIDRRLAALERARGFVDWEKVRTFAADLEATVKTIVQELGSLDPLAAAERLLRFLATHGSVGERVDDSGGRIDRIYDDAIDALAPLAERMAQADRSRLPDLVMTALGEKSPAYLTSVAHALVKHIPAAALKAWDKQLAAMVKPAAAGKRDWEWESHSSDALAARQSIAEALGDLDGLIALEEAKHPNHRDTLEIAGRLLAAGRAKEALGWVRRKRISGFRYMPHDDMADDAEPRDPRDLQRVGLEARILEVLGNRPEAQALRWTAFETTLDAGMLREHIERLEDFAEFEVTDRAFDHAAKSKHADRALAFFLDWPRLDRAAALVIDKAGQWDGRHYHLLAPAAETLETDYPAAAALLYRALLDDILTRAKSMAYAHGARYLERLDALAPATLPGVESHATYRSRLVKTHGRKAGFWALVRKV